MAKRKRLSKAELAPGKDVGVKITGADIIAKNMVNVKAHLAEGLVRGLKKAGLFLQRESQKIVPVDVGNLKNSAFTRVVEGTSGLKTEVVVGYTADYAIYVHEDLNAQHKSGKKAKYLEGPARKFRKEIRNKIKEEMDL